MLMTCKDAIAVLADFLEQALPSDVGDELDAHLRDCAPCRAYLNTYRRTRGLVGGMGHVQMPAELKSRLRQFLLEQFGKEAS
jgi:predicted anti-sigma-YlaC factor YlaD